MAASSRLGRFGRQTIAAAAQSVLDGPARFTPSELVTHKRVDLATHESTSVCSAYHSAHKMHEVYGRNCITIRCLITSEPAHLINGELLALQSDSDWHSRRISEETLQVGKHLPL